MRHRPELIGADNITIHDSCEFADNVVLDATHGRIVLAHGCRVGHHSRIQSTGRGVSIGAESTIGHDSFLSDDFGAIQLAERSTIGANATVKGSAEGVTLADDCSIGDGSRIDSLGGRIAFGPRTVVGRHSVVVGTGQGVQVLGDCEFEYGATIDAQSGSIVIGRFSGSGPYATLYGHGGLRIGEHCAIAGYVVIIPANHRFERTDAPIRAQGLSTAGVSIGNDIWIGTHTIVLDGSVIEDGCVIGAGSIVRGTVRAKSVVVGVPGRVIRTRGAGDFERRTLALQER